MKKSGASQGQSASELISKRIAELGDWRGKTLGRMRKLIKEADPDVVEEWKWRGVPVWSHDELICTGETYRNAVKLTFSKGALLKDPSGLFNSSLEGNAGALSTSTKEKKLTRPPSRRSFARRSPSTVPASRDPNPEIGFQHESTTTRRVSRTRQTSPQLIGESVPAQGRPRRRCPNGVSSWCSWRLSVSIPDSGSKPSKKAKS